MLRDIHVKEDHLKNMDIRETVNVYVANDHAWSTYILGGQQVEGTKYKINNVRSSNGGQ